MNQPKIQFLVENYTPITTGIILVRINAPINPICGMSLEKNNTIIDLYRGSKYSNTSKLEKSLCHENQI